MVKTACSVQTPLPSPSCKCSGVPLASSVAPLPARLERASLSSRRCSVSQNRVQDLLRCREVKRDRETLRV